MALGKIDHIDIVVDDLEKAEEFFTKKLGFKLLRRTDHFGKSVELESPAGDFFFDFHQGNEDAYKMEKELKGPGGLPHFGHIAFKVDDINKEYDDLKSKGVKFRLAAPHLTPSTGRTVADTYDADGRFWFQLTD